MNTGTFYASCCFSIRNPELSRKDGRGQQALLREAVGENKMEINTCLPGKQLHPGHLQVSGSQEEKEVTWL